MQKQFEDAFHIGNERRPAAGFCRIIGKSVMILCQFAYGLYWLCGLAGVIFIAAVPQAGNSDASGLGAIGALIALAVGSLFVAMMLVVVLAASVIVYQYGAAD